MFNYITGIHRYATNSGIPGLVAGMSVMVIDGIPRSIIDAVWINDTAKVRIDQISLASVLVGHYMITPFEPSVAEIEAIRERADEVDLNTHMSMSISSRQTREV